MVTNNSSLIMTNQEAVYGDKLHALYIDTPGGCFTVTNHMPFYSDKPRGCL